jgi:hypothetical protein
MLDFAKGRGLTTELVRYGPSPSTSVGINDSIGAINTCGPQMIVECLGRAGFKRFGGIFEEAMSFI